MDGTSRMTRECHVRICERLGLRFPGPTRQPAVRNFREGDGNNGIIEARSAPSPSSTGTQPDIVDTKAGMI